MNSIEMVNRLGSGWNLGNSFDAFKMKSHVGETAWHNPVVTAELLQEIKHQGFSSIRIPLTVMDRHDQKNQIDADFLDRFQEVVDWALEDGFYVIINLHHDSIW